ncbi:S49 family peptidase [Mesorhizobium sp. M6A.T.Ca.TU.002.02.2.1]|nr:S49 family peptidase [Mesorhizobium sp. M6A.T.Ca.TU.002.02.2.1]
MPTRFPHLRAAVLQHPWAIMPDRLEAIAEVIERRVEGVRLSADEIAGIKGNREPNGVASLLNSDTLEPTAGEARAAGGTGGPSVIAVISVFGIIAQHARQVDDISGPGGTSTERVLSSFRSALNDPNVKAIVLNIDSPGGNVNGVQVLADEIFNARGQKPVVAQVNSLAASAAYWIACSCDEIVVTPGGQVGSIGVYALHRDVSKAAEMDGFKFTFISAGKYKVEGNQFEPLNDEASKAIQDQIDAYYSDFTTAVARGRGVDAADVVAGFGQGRTEKDKKAVKAGMADRVATMDDTLRKLAAAKKPSGAKAMALPVAEAPDDAIGAQLESRTSGESREIHLIGTFPACLLISGELADGTVADHGGVVSVEVASKTLWFVLANGSASYSIEAQTEQGDWICRILEAEMKDPPRAAETPDRDAFRRRRHALRARGA